MVYAAPDKDMGTSHPASEEEALGTTEEETAVVTVSAETLASALASMSRFLAVMEAHPTYTESNLGLSSWMALSAIAKSKGGEGLSIRKLARILGLPNRKAEQLVAGLVQEGAVAARQEGKRKFAVSPKGEERLRDINAELDALLASSKARALTRVEKALHVASRLFVIPKERNEKARASKGKRKKASERESED
jgi:predicted transcriptional regulator